MFGKIEEAWFFYVEKHFGVKIFSKYSCLEKLRKLGFFM
jgi:hypothetical protein